MIEYLLTGGALFAGIIVHVMKKVIERRQQNVNFSLKDYLMQYPYQTVTCVMMGVGAYFGLISGDSLTMSSAFLAGIASNSLAGAAPGSR